MPSAPLPPEKDAEIQDLARAIREAIDVEINELAANLATTDDAHLFGANEFKIRAIAHRIAAKAVEQHLAARPPITVPTIVLQGEGDGVATATRADTQARFFTGPYGRRMIPRIGHDVPQEAPQETAAAVLDLLRDAP